MFIIAAKYIKPVEEIDRALSEHYEFLGKYYAQGIFICSGRMSPRIGGVIICNAADRAEVEKIIEEDIFSRNKLVKYEIIEFIPTKYADGFEKFICQ